MTNKRDYKKEYERRKQRDARLIADIDKNLASRLKEYLKEQKITYAEWLKNKINQDINKG